MVSPVQTLRSDISGDRPPAGKLEGELYVNFADKQIGVVDTAGTPQDLLEIRMFSEEIIYTDDQGVFHLGSLCTPRYDTVGPGPFKIEQWDMIPYLKLKEDTEYWVEEIGDDETGDGSQANPWRSLKKPLTFLSRNIDLNSKGAHIHLGVGSFEGGGFIGGIGTGTIRIQGAGSTQTFITNGGVYQSLFSCLAVSAPNIIFIINNLTFIPDRTSYGIVVFSKLYFGEYSNPVDIAFSTEKGPYFLINTHGDCYLFIYPGLIEVRSHGVSIRNVFLCESANTIIYNQCNWSFTGTQDTMLNFIYMYDGKFSATASYPPHTFTGVLPAGNKFGLVTGAEVWTGDYQGAAAAAPGGLDYFPGTNPGTWDTTSTYDGIAGTTLVVHKPPEPKKLNDVFEDVPKTPKSNSRFTSSRKVELW
jgi:hypothetical protein